MTVAAFLPAGRPLSLLQIARPLLLLAVLAFLAGFGGYLILGPPNVMNLGAMHSRTAAAVSPTTEVSAPAPSLANDWNAPKHI